MKIATASCKAPLRVTWQARNGFQTQKGGRVLGGYGGSLESSLPKAGYLPAWNPHFFPGHWKPTGSLIVDAKVAGVLKKGLGLDPAIQVPLVLLELPGTTFQIAHNLADPGS